MEHSGKLIVENGLKKIVCPKCGSEAIVDTSRVYTSNPLKYEVDCPKCGKFYEDCSKINAQIYEESSKSDLMESIKKVLKDNLTIDIRNDLYGNSHICLLFGGKLIDSVELPLDEEFPISNG